MSALRLLLLPLGLAVGGIAVAALPSGVLFSEPAAVSSSSEEAPVGRWACPMFCTITDHPGRCPVCGMALEPVGDHGDRVILTHHERRMIGLEEAGSLR